MMPILSLMVLIALLILRIRRTQNIPFIERHYEWAIGIYTADQFPDFLPAKGARNPVITAKDVTDIRCKFAADPFMIKHQERWHLFFESYNLDANKGEIGFADSSDGLKWKYRKIVLREPYHVSFPTVFEWDGCFYMIPETLSQKSIRLYRATRFPDEWAFEKELLAGEMFNDSSVVRFQNRWWIFTGIHPWTNDALNLYYAEDLLGPWKAHAKNPVISNNASMARPGGRPIEDKGKLVRFTQDCELFYGRQLRAFRIDTLSPTEYAESEIYHTPFFAGSMRERWNALGAHHIDPWRLDDGKWLACMDGFRLGWRFGWRRKMVLDDFKRPSTDAKAIQYAASRMNTP